MHPHRRTHDTLRPPSASERNLTHRSTHAPLIGDTAPPTVARLHPRRAAIASPLALLAISRAVGQPSRG
eukprot:1481203-Prymnesium_polylepis.1